MTIEEEFRRFVDSLQIEQGTHLQQVLKDLEVDEVAPEFQSCFSFWKDLSGASKNFLLDVSQGRRIKKKSSK